MSRKLFVAMSSLFASAMIVGVLFVPASSASPSHAAAQTKPAGLTARGVTNARAVGIPSKLVAMAPQTSLHLLSQATRLGPHAPRSKIKLTVSMQLAHPLKLHEFLQEVQNPGSPLYHQWLTPEQGTSRFGPTEAQVQTVVNWLESQGIQVLGITPNRLLIHTKASTVVYDNAFGIEISDYKLNGRTFYSTADRPKLPRALAGLVQNVVGLDRAVQMRPMHKLSDRQPTSVRAHAVSPYAPPIPATSTSYFRPFQIATAYNVPDINDTSNGQGVTIAILTAVSPNVAHALATHDFWRALGLPDHSVTVKTVPEGATVKPVPGGMLESMLDIQWSGVWAPGADLLVYVAAEGTFVNFLDMYSQFQTDNAAQVMTTSWGSLEQGGTLEQTEENIFALAAAQGISMFASAGDSGSGAGSGTPNACTFPSASLYVTAAGGTELTTDIEGHRISEVASTDTGGAICTLPQPDWQVGAGVPRNDQRNTSDISLNYGIVTPYLVLFNNAWYYVQGTSAVAPELAGMFAVASSRHGGDRLGQSNELIYNLVNTGHYSTDFFDVTSGSNGAYSAGPGWDHPTGWGAPNAARLISHLGIQGPKGTLKGTVTAAAGGAPIVHAKIVATTSGGIHYSTTTLTDGSYSIVLPAGTLDVEVRAFGFTTLSPSVSIADGEATTKNFTLEAAPMATLSGTVTDGSGHGYGLYALIHVSTRDFGEVALVWTDPKTGAYSEELPKGFDYTLNVQAAYDGYQTSKTTLTFNADTTQNFVLPISLACTAPGYGYGGLAQDFNGAIFPPDGWTVINAKVNPNPAQNVFWRSNSVLFDDNWTGGTGNAAEASSPVAGYASAGYDTSLITPPVDVSSLTGGTILKYKANYQIIISGDEAFDLDITTDGGSTWRNILHWTDDHGSFRLLPGVNVSVDLAPYLPASGEFQLRWRYYNPGVYRWYAQIDDVSTGVCQPFPGGLVMGRVSDANTGAGIVGATVTADNGASTQTIVNPADPNIPTGFYAFFVPQGGHVLTATAYNYSPATANVKVPDDGSVGQDFSLNASAFEANPDAISLHVMVNNSATASFALSNTGSGVGSFHVLPFEAPSPMSAAAVGPFAEAPDYPAATNLSALVAPNANPHPTGRATPSLHPHAAGDVVASFWAKIPTYGLGVDRSANDLWLGSPNYATIHGDAKDHRFLFDGTNTGDTIDLSSLPFSVLYMGDMAFDANTGMLWQIGIEDSAANGSQSHIWELNPVTMKPTGNSILIPSPQSERGLAYDPVSNTWYAGDFSSKVVYHFDASGTLLDSANVGLGLAGLAYNAATGHLFVLTSAGQHAIYVLDVDRNYAQVGHFDVAGFDPANSGSGLGYTCSGNLVISDFQSHVVYIAKSGEPGWCYGVPWLTLAPSQGTLNMGASKAVTLTVDGTGQVPFTTSQAFLSVANNSPYGRVTVPLTVTWGPQPVDLALTGAASPDPLQKGGNLTYTLTVTNKQAANHGSATETTLSYSLPDGVSFAAANGDATCSASGGTLACDFGEIALSASETETIAVKVARAGTLKSTFSVTSREPDSDTKNNTVTVNTTVIGTADVSATASGSTIHKGKVGSVKFVVSNAGPDTATNVKLHANSVGGVELTGATTGKGSCAAANGALTCTIGEIEAGGTVAVTMAATGTKVGTATVQAQAFTSSDDPDQANNVATAAVTVKATSSGGGGALGWLALAVLLGLALASTKVRKG